MICLLPGARQGGRRGRREEGALKIDITVIE
jgi:hypothetical protein